MSWYSDRERDDYSARGRPQHRYRSSDSALHPKPYDDGPHVVGGNPAHGRFPRETYTLQVPSGGQYKRPRSVPPNQQILNSRSPSRHVRSTSRSSPRHVDDRHRGENTQPRPSSRCPIDQVRSIADKTFSTSASGLGVSLLGAVVGGIAAREVSSTALRTRSKKEVDDSMNAPDFHAHDREDGPIYNHPHPLARHRSSSIGKKEADKSRLMSTVVGAIVGGLGANAIERRFESTRQRHREEQEAWERKWGRRAGRDERDSDLGGGDSRRSVIRRDEYRSWDGRFHDDRGRGSR